MNQRIINVKTNEHTLNFSKLRLGDFFTFIDGKDGEKSKNILIKQTNKTALHLIMGDIITFPPDRKVKLVRLLNLIQLKLDIT